MNTRDYKIFHENGYYHIYNRGDNKENIFLEEQDYFNFLKRLKLTLGIITPKMTIGTGPERSRRALRIAPLPKNSFDILSYCLMPNHFHFFIRQNNDIPITKLMNRLCTSYAKYFNKKYGRTGNLFQDTFKAKTVTDDSYATYLSAYIHNNPIDPMTYLYSSFLDYLGVRQGQICNTEFILKYFNNDSEAYKKFVLSYSDNEAKIIRDLLFEE